MNLDEERRRLSATWVNFIAAAFVSGGAIAPIATNSASLQLGWRHLLIGGLSVLAGVVTHLAARAILRIPQSAEEKHTTRDTSIHEHKT